MKSKQIICEENFFHDLFMDYYPSLLSFACYYVEEEVVAEDLVQDVFVKMWEQRGRWKAVENFSAYVYQMVRFRCFNYLRGEKLREEMMRSYREEKVDVMEANRYMEEEIFTLVNQAMEALPPTYRQVITMSMEGYRVKEIAQKLNVGEETVKKRKQAAKQVLKEKLGKLYLFLAPLI